MKKILVSLAACSFLSQVSAAQAETNSYAYDALGRLIATQNDRGTTDADVTAYFLDAAGNRRHIAAASATTQIVPVFRFYKSTGVHFYTSQFMEGVGAGFNIEGPTFYLYRSGGAGYTALYRCYVSWDDHHFMTANSNCDGYNNEGIIGYVSNAPASGLRPLYRFYRASTIDHLITMDYQEGVNNGYALEGTFGYVPS